MKLKVCGLSNPNDVKICVDYNVNFCGFILNFPKSHRNLSFEKARELTNIEKNKTKYVGVLVNPIEKELVDFSKLKFDYFQIYGDLNNRLLSNIKNRFNKKVISSIQVRKKEDVENYKKVESESDIILWDSSGYEESLSWDFNWLKTVSTPVEKMVAGNITIEKLQNLVRIADIIDVSGALETNKVKDIKKIKKFIKVINKINNEN